MSLYDKPGSHEYLILDPERHAKSTGVNWKKTEIMIAKSLFLELLSTIRKKKKKGAKILYISIEQLQDVKNYKKLFSKS